MAVFFYILGGFGVLILLYEITYIVWYSYKAVAAGKRTIPVSRDIQNSRKRVLVVGDSTAYGTGATRTECSLVGRLATEFQDVAIINASQNGLNLAGLSKKMETISGVYDIIVIHIGGIDTLSFTSTYSMRRSWKHIHARIKELHIPVTILVTVNNVGLAPFMQFITRILYLARSKYMNRFFSSLAAEYHIEHVSLYEPPGNDILAQDPTRLFSNDKIHPSDLGYEVWYKKIAPTVRKHLSLP